MFVSMRQHDRQTALAEFTAAKVSVLVATDVASRGLDIKGIAHVINADLPKTFEDYVHRIGQFATVVTLGCPCMRAKQTGISPCVFFSSLVCMRVCMINND